MKLTTEDRLKAEKKYQTDIRRKMKAVNTYDKSFEHGIRVLAKTLVDYDDVIQQFEDGGAEIVVEYTNKNGSTNKVKSPLYMALEKLRDDILLYSRELGLTPAGLKKIKESVGGNKSGSKLEEALKKLGAG